jgi:GNAT superfamily N-acetyltransferase
VEVGVRPAVPDDEPRLAVMRADAIAEQVASRGGLVWSEREALREPPGESQTFVGTIDDAPVGYASVGLDTLAGGGQLGIVTAIFVEPEGREVAVGEAMLDAVIEWCTSKGCIGVDAHALPGNRETKNFFETFGFTARLLVVHKKLT